MKPWYKIITPREDLRDGREGRVGGLRLGRGRGDERDGDGDG